MSCLSPHTLKKTPPNPPHLHEKGKKKVHSEIILKIKRVWDAVLWNNAFLSQLFQTTFEKNNNNLEDPKIFWIPLNKLHPFHVKHNPQSTGEFWSVEETKWRPFHCHYDSPCREHGALKTTDWPFKQIAVHCSYQDNIWEVDRNKEKNVCASEGFETSLRTST